MITWPSELPVMLIGSTYQPIDPKMRSQTQSGRTISRRRFSDVPEEFNASWIFTSSESVLFETFYRRDLEEGTQWFNMPIYLPQIKGVRPVQFVGIYQRRQVSPGTSCNMWEYSAQMRHYLRFSE